MIIYEYKTIILPVVLCSCETLSLTLMEERRLRVFENRVLGRIFVPRVIRMGREQDFTMENFIVYTVTKIVNVIKSRLRWKDHIARMEECRSAFKMLTGKPKERDL
jgi:hypothetical protein